MNSKLKIGITGGLGLVGKALRHSLSENAVFVSRQESTDLKPTEKKIVGSFADETVMEELTSELDVLIHLATSVGPRSDYDISFIENDLVGTIALYKVFFKKNPTGHFIYISTAGGLYDLHDPTPKTEESELCPTGMYGAIKLAVEDYLELNPSEKGMVTILRPSAIYGDSFKKNQTTGLIDKLLKSTLKESINEHVPIFDQLNSARDYLHVNDLVRAIKLVMNRKGSLFEVYNVGSGVEFSIKEVMTIVNNMSDEKTRTDIHKVTTGVTSLIVNSSKLFEAVGWKAEISLHEGIKKMYLKLKNKESK